MLLILHISCALVSVLYVTYTIMSPSRAKLRASYALSALTIISGTYLVLHSHAPLTSSCVAGLVYVGLMASGIRYARYKLARAII